VKTVDLIQGSPEWHAHRRAHWNASDAPAMMGASPYKTRAQLLRELATGIVPEVDAVTQARFDAGHRFEALARPLAEKIVGEDLYPCVGTYGKWSASFDGLTLTGEVAWEHKSVNAELRELIRRAEEGEPIHADHLPEHYQIQMDHQALVSGARSVLFMATRWEGDELAEQFWCWYSPNAERQMRIAAGWEQFERDLAAYVPEQTEAKLIAAPVEGFGVLALRVEGRVLASNLDAFRAGADAFLARLPKPAELQTDQDFADADAAVKACAEAEDRIKAAKALALAQMADVDAVLRTADSIAETIRAARLALDRAVFTEKDRRKSALVSAGVDAVRAHYAEINATLGEHAIAPPATLASEIGGAIKGLKTLASMRDKIDAAVAAAKIDASQRTERVRQCVAVMAGHAEYSHLFVGDRVMLCRDKSPEDLRNMVTARIADHQRREEQRIREAEERVRQQVEAAAKREQEAREIGNALKIDAAFSASAAARGVEFRQEPLPHRRIKLGDINAAIAPLSITADGLAQLGFTHVATDKAAKLYDEANFKPILSALAKVIARADLRREAA